MGATKDQQVKHVVEGVALGVLAAGVGALTSSKFTVEMNFNWMWRRWDRAGSFASVAGHDPGNLFWIGVSKSEGRRMAWATWVRDGAWVVPQVTFEDWSIEECLNESFDEVVRSVSPPPSPQKRSAARQSG